MNTNDPKGVWDAYVARERTALEPVLASLGYTLDHVQPHLGGERYLMQAITTHSGRKLILLGTRMSDGKRVVIKATGDTSGTRELEHERVCRQALKEINFAYQVLFSPEELLFTTVGARTIFIQAFIEQESTFLARPLTEQFALALKAFKAQESAHATTYKHQRLIERTFGRMDSVEYLKTFERFGAPQAAYEFLQKNKDTIDQYSDFLTHTDFVPHNIRIANGKIYLLDSSSLRFGNKYEGWARFLNFMTLYNPALETALVQYVRDNRTPEESLALRLMRHAIYHSTFLYSS